MFYYYKNFINIASACAEHFVTVKFDITYVF